MKLKNISDLAKDICIALKIDNTSAQTNLAKTLEIIYVLDAQAVLSGEFQNAPLSILNRYSIKKQFSMENLSFKPVKKSKTRTRSGSH